MTSPKSDIYQMNVQNPHASAPLIIPVLVLCNTSDDVLRRNIGTNSALPLDWVQFENAHECPAILVGGGPSVADNLDEIRLLVEGGATVFAMNAASKFLHEHGIAVNYQVIADAKQETSTLVDCNASHLLIASQVDPSTLAAAISSGSRVALWHLAIDDMDDLFPEDKVKRGGYALVGGGASVGNSALCLAYVLGYREIHCFGYDSSHRGDESHAYSQPMNKFIPAVEVEWAGKTYRSSVAMKAQAEKFQITAQALNQEGCEVVVHGDGLLPAMYNTPPAHLTERDKYRLMWQFDGYRDFSPGEEIVPRFLEVAKPDGLIVDFGCGTGKASIALSKSGHDVFMVDFADNCRDDEAKNLPFLEWDMTHPMPMRSPFGICADVMEHIPEKDAETVVRNILEASNKVFFQISTVQDKFGDVIGQRLHCTVKPHVWWAELFQSIGATIIWQQDRQNASCFFVTRNLSERA